LFALKSVTREINTVNVHDAVNPALRFAVLRSTSRGVLV
jgi:hypothetical protein